MYPVEFLEDAETDAKKISQYLDKQLPDLGYRFIENLYDGALGISKNPEGFHYCNTTKKIRRFNLTRFSYATCYVLSDNHRVLILSKLHTRRPNAF